MAKTSTCHDAVLIFKQSSFLAEIKNYEITLRVYPAPIPDIPGRFYVIIRDEEVFYDSAWVVNLHKRSVAKIGLKKVYDEIEKSKKPENNELMEYKRKLREAPREVITI